MDVVKHKLAILRTKLDGFKPLQQAEVGAAVFLASCSIQRRSAAQPRLGPFALCCSLVAYNVLSSFNPFFNTE